MRRQRPRKTRELARPSSQYFLKHKPGLCSQLSALSHQIAIPSGAWPGHLIPYLANWHSIFHRIPWLPGTVGDALQYQLAQTGFSAQILDKVCGPLMLVQVPRYVPPGNEGLLVHSFPWECLGRSQFRNKRSYPLPSPIWTAEIDKRIVIYYSRSLCVHKGLGPSLSCKD